MGISESPSGDGRLPGATRTAQMQAWDLSGNTIVGCGNGPTGSYDMWTWTSAGGFVNLGPSGGFSCAYAINSRGFIAGTSDMLGGTGGFTWSRGRGFILHMGGEIAHDLNGAGFAAGEANGFFDAYVADPRGVVTLLPHLVPGNFASSASAYGINACGDVVGWSNDPFIGETHPVWWPGHQCP